MTKGSIFRGLQMRRMFPIFERFVDLGCLEPHPGHGARLVLA